MKKFNLLKTLLIVGLFGVVVPANAQTISYPLAFDARTLTGGTAAPSNWYKDYIGVRVEVTAPSVIAGDYTYTTANDGTGATGSWGTFISTPLVNVPIFIDSTIDSFGSAPFSPADMASIISTTPHKIVVVWRGPEGAGAIDFGCKAQRAQAAGASAVVIVNEYAGQPPVGMGASVTCTGPFTIPVFMIGNLDGINVCAQYWSGVPVTMTITPWGSGLANDIGIIPGGEAIWHDYAMPANQISNNVNLNQLDGAFIANFGDSTSPTSTGTADGVKLTANLTFNSTGGGPTTIHSDSVVFTASTPGVNYYSSIGTASGPGATYPFRVKDSIIAMFAPAEYSLGTPSGAGRYDLTYNASVPDVTDQNPADNSLTYSFYATDSLYSKGRYDFVNNQPVVGESEQFGAGAEFLWGPMYFVGPTAGTAVSRIQYLLAQNGTTPPTTILLSDNGDIGNFVYIYKWVDGGDGSTPDSLVEDGELQLVSASIYTFNSTTDTSGALLQLVRNNTHPDVTGGKYIGDANGNQNTVFLDANSWYYISVDVPASDFLGIDGQANPFPRVYGRAHTSNILDYSSIEEVDSTFSTRLQIEPPCEGFNTNFVFDIDSFQLHSIKGLIPAVSMIVNNHPDTTGEAEAVGVKNVNKTSMSLSVYPNPTSDYLNVSISLPQPSKVVYEITDGLGRFVSKETHYNVQSEIYTIPTSNLKPGNYHIAAAINGQLQVRPFTVIR